MHHQRIGYFLVCLLLTGCASSAGKAPASEKALTCPSGQVRVCRSRSSMTVGKGTKEDYDSCTCKPAAQAPGY